MKKKITHVVGIDGAGEKACGAFARGCLLFRSMRNSDNLNSSCKEEAALNNAKYA